MAYLELRGLALGGEGLGLEAVLRGGEGGLGARRAGERSERGSVGVVLVATRDEGGRSWSYGLP